VLSADPALTRRVVSAAILAPLVLGLTLLGVWPFDGLIALALLVLAWEWGKLTEARFGRAQGLFAGGTAALGGLLALGCAALGAWSAALLALVLAAIGTGIAGWLLGMAALWAACGVLYLGLPALALVWLQALPGIGVKLIIWLLLVVWATDIAAYFVGRRLGGPRLAPAISPGKTWSGLLGGVLGAGLVGAVAALAGGIGRPLAAAVLAMVLAVTAQLGDLAQSKLKRLAGLKDSGRLIPGHGGLLDRVDGLLAAAPMLVLLGPLLGLEVAPWR
jgi:phosphatidate cytidylyltransferase